MGLFDDILKKPEHTGAQSDPLSGVSGGTASTGSTSGGQPPADDTHIIIQKSSEETVFGAETEARDAEAMATISQPTVQASEDTSSLIISTPIAESTPIVSTPTPTLETPVVVEPVAMTSPIITEAPVVEAPIIDMTPTPAPSVVAAPTPIIDTPVVTPSIPTAPAASGSIFDSIMTESTPIPAPVALDPAVEPAVESAPLSNLWGETPATVVTPTAAIETPAAVVQTESVATHNFTTPREFLEKSIANIDVMLGNIDTRHAAKEAEELGYKMEKLRYTELEKTAHTEKIIMDKERDHAIAMKKMLEKEIEKDEENKKHVTSVESTLSDIGAKHPVHKHHKTEHTEA